MGSEMTAAAVGGVGQVRRDPMAMLPFAGYHMGDYFRHWLEMGKQIEHRPRIFHVNWFRRDKEGKFMWPGFGENMRVLEWIVDRCLGCAAAEETPIGLMPEAKDFNLNGLEGFDAEKFADIQKIDKEEWHREVMSQEEFFMKLWDHFPKELMLQREMLVSRL